MLQIIRIIAVAAISIGVSITNDDSIIIPAIMVFLGLILLKITETKDGEGDE